MGQLKTLTNEHTTTTETAEKAAADLERKAETVKMTDKAFKYQEERVSSVKSEQRGLVKQHDELHRELSLQLTTVEQTWEEQLQNLQLEGAANSKEKTKWNEAEAMSASAKASHEAALKLSDDTSQALAKAEVDTEHAAKANADAMVLKETKDKELIDAKSMYNKAMIESIAQKGVDANDEKAMEWLAAHKKEKAAAAAAATAEATKATEFVSKQEAALAKAQSDAEIASEAIMNSQIVKNAAEQQLSKTKLHETLQVEQLASASKVLSELRIEAAAMEDAHRVAAATAQQLVVKSTDLARSSVTANSKGA